MTKQNGITNGPLAILAALFQKGGFAAMSAALLAVVVWQQSQSNQLQGEMLQMQRETNEVITRFTVAFEKMSLILEAKD